MSEEDIRNYLSRQNSTPQPTAIPQPRMVRRRRAEAPESYKNFSATHLLCPRCKKAQPVRERLLLVLPGGDLYDYNCTVCGTSVGTRKAGR